MQKAIDEERRLFNCCASGDPYLIIVQDGDVVRSAIKEGFSIGLVFEFILNHVEFADNEETKSELANFIIELSKKL